MKRDRKQIAIDLDIQSFKKLMIEEGHGEPEDHIALAALHKARCTLAMAGEVDREIGAESGRWLVERDMWHGIRWWILK